MSQVFSRSVGCAPDILQVLDDAYLYRDREGAVRDTASLNVTRASSTSKTNQISTPTTPSSDAISTRVSAPENKHPYPAPAKVPTQEGAEGVRFDFNDGRWVTLPEGEHPWHV
jgi:hypothetical protein